MKLFELMQLGQLLQALRRIIHLDGQAGYVGKRTDQQLQLVGWREVVGGQVGQRDVINSWAGGGHEGQQLLHVLQVTILLRVLHLHRRHTITMLPEGQDEGLGSAGAREHGRF